MIRVFQLQGWDILSNYSSTLDSFKLLLDIDSSVEHIISTFKILDHILLVYLLLSFLSPSNLNPQTNIAHNQSNERQNID